MPHLFHNSYSTTLALHLSVEQEKWGILEQRLGPSPPQPVLGLAASHFPWLTSDFPPVPLQSLLFLALVVAVGLGLNLIFLATYLICQSCRRPGRTLTTKRNESCSVTWMAVVAGLGCW